MCVPSFQLILVVNKPVKTTLHWSPISSMHLGLDLFSKMHSVSFRSNATLSLFSDRFCLVPRFVHRWRAFFQYQLLSTDGGRAQSVRGCRTCLLLNTQYQVCPQMAGVDFSSKFCLQMAGVHAVPRHVYGSPLDTLGQALAGGQRHLSHVHQPGHR